jgi:hypothetical protein
VTTPLNLQQAMNYLSGGEERDIPSDCHNHCSHWETEGECCECGDVRTPNHGYISEPTPKPEEWPYYETDPQ